MEQTVEDPRCRDFRLSVDGTFGFKLFPASPMLNVSKHCRVCDHIQQVFTLGGVNTCNVQNRVEEKTTTRYRSIGWISGGSYEPAACLMPGGVDSC